MKNFLIIFAMFFSISSFANAKSITKCVLNLRPAGIWFNQCPPRMVVDAVDVWNPNSSPYPRVRVRCAIPEIFCTDLKKKL
jgi:hypothetical protein